MVFHLKRQKQSVEMIVTGIVQGVGFRYATIKLAEALNINGWVKNKPDGSVQVMASGSPDNLTRFVNKIKQSPTPYGRVDHITVNYITNFDHKGFDVKY